MELFINEKNCLSVTGRLGARKGYYIRKCRGHLISQRNARGYVPADGHLCFILDAAFLGKQGMYIKDVKVVWKELCDALNEAGRYTAAQNVEANYRKGKVFYNARDLINLKTSFGL